MRNRTDLFHLIKAMSKSEKRYFVLDAKKSGRRASRYLALFEALNKMEEFDEEKLKKKFPKNLSSDKAYLYEAILRSMRDYRSASSKAAQVKERLMDARFLYERGLYDQSNARILQAKTLATELEDNFSLLEIIKEEQLSLFDRRIKVTPEQVLTIQKDKKIIEKNIEEELKYIGLYCSLVVEFFRHGVLKNKNNIDEIKKNIPIHLLDKKNKPTSKLALRRYYLCKASYNRLMGNVQETKKYYEKAALWWAEYPSIKEEDYYRYVGDVSNLINICYTDPRLFPIAQEWFDKLKIEQSGRTYHEKKYVFLSLSLSNLLHHMNNGDRPSTEIAVKTVTEGLEKYNLTKSLALLANIVTAYFWVKDYNNCIKWATKIIDLKKNTRKDIQSIMMLYRLVAYYELGMIDELDTGVRSVGRFFKKVNISKDSFEFVLLDNYLKNIFNAPLGEVNKYLNELRVYLNSIEKNKILEQPIGLGEFLDWVNLKLGVTKNISTQATNIRKT